MTETVDVLIVGAGFSGLCMAIQQIQAGNRDFLILEAADEAGGRWRDNDYPGCACDIPSHLYSLSFAPKPDWRRMYASRQEIFFYLRDVAERFALRGHIRFGTKVVHAAWHEREAAWVVRTEDGRAFAGRVLALGTGGLLVPRVPDYPGLETFAGPRFHSAAWDHAIDLAGKRVAVIGTGASAIQFVPEVARLAAKLYLFQRTPPWILPRPDFAFSDRQLGRLRNPLLRRLFRAWIYLSHEMRAAAFLGDKRLSAAWRKRAQATAMKHLASQIRRPALRMMLMPDHAMGCKRVLLSNDYYPAVARPNVELVVRKIGEVRAHAVVTEDGAVRDVDVIIYGTGFHTTDAFGGLDVAGRHGVTLASALAGGRQAHWGVTVPGFPNLFLLMGPHTRLAHNSEVLMIEAQVRYATSLLRAMRARGWQAAEVRADAERAYDTRLQQLIARTVWQTGGCRRGYQDEGGRNIRLWPGLAMRYMWGTRRARISEYDRIR